MIVNDEMPSRPRREKPGTEKQDDGVLSVLIPLRLVSWTKLLLDLRLLGPLSYPWELEFSTVRSRTCSRQ